MNQTKRTTSQKARIKEHLESGNPITPIEALNNYGCFRLAAIIHTLKHYEGMNIKTEIRKMDGKRWAVYSLNNTKTDINTLIQAAENNS